MEVVAVEIAWPIDFFQVVYGEDAPGFLVLFTLPGRQSLWIPALSLEEAHHHTLRLAKGENLYVGIALQDRDEAFTKWRAEWRAQNPGVGEPREPRTRGYSETARALPGLWADIDIQSPAHAAVNLPSTKAAARALLATFPLLPTLVIDSGHGLQAWWLLRELWIFDNEAERHAAQTLARRFLATLQANARAHGWQIDPVADLARVLRVPGTFNRKRTPALPVTVVEENAVRYNPSDFGPYLDLVEADPAPEPSTTRRPWSGPTGEVAPVLRWCQFIQHCGDHAATLSEPYWWGMIGNLARLAGGKEAIHALSRLYPRYSQAETEQKIAYALKAPAGPQSCQYIQKILGFTGCPAGGCGVKAPAALGVSLRAVNKLEEKALLADAIAQARKDQASALALRQALLARRAK